MNTISVLFDEEPQSTREGYLGDSTPRSGASSKTVIKEVDADKVKDSLSRLTGAMSDILKDARAVGDFKLKSVQLAVQISAEGGVSLVASAKAGMSGTISLTFEEK